MYKIQPDIVNAHYASSYGVAMALSGIDNYILSVWGSDIYDFPKKSIFHKNLLKYSLKKARYLFSTSKAMAKEASKYTDKKFEITPFGVDMELFNPNKRTRPKIDAPFVLGTVKSLDDKYGIDYILKAASIIRKNNPEIDISVRIAGEGPKADEYQNLAIKLGIENCTSFLGLISQQEAAIEWANMDIAILPSILYESFGVAAVEAEASGTSIIISDVPGLMETTIPGQSSEMVPKKDAGAIADAILKLYYHPEMRQQMGEIGRQYVTEKYELNKCFADIEKYFEIWRGGYKTVTESRKKGVIIFLELRKKQEFVVGTIKGLSDKYGIKYILEAVSEIRSYKKIPIKLRIAGKGPDEVRYRKLADDLGINDTVTWLGFISQEKAAVEWANMDIAIIPSVLESESFGVAAVEAQASGTAVIISDVPGLMETTKPGETSIVVPKEDSKAIACAIMKLYMKSDFREIAEKGMLYVQSRYELNKCFSYIERLYKTYMNELSVI